ncbi:unnamed protein product [Heligmosomoides polygyrus]|uniref:FSA_C domain-containing protein n=1 Tax=Heligmosomoides polygyrus TaxID=6339 RepID=A0A183GFF9_HELPZ|nr:unnamed protein product [Heligmosomoides polygyrus]
MRFADTRWTRAVTDWIPRDVKRTPGRPPTDFFVKALNVDMTLFVSLEREGSIGPLWHATGTNGDAAGARSSKSMINGTTGDKVISGMECAMHLSKILHFTLD